MEFQLNNFEVELPRSNFEVELPRSNFEVELPLSNFEVELPLSNFEVELPRSNFEVELQRSSLISAQGCFNPGEPNHPWIQRQRRSRTLSALIVFSLLNPGLKQPWAEICERFRRLSFIQKLLCIIAQGCRVYLCKAAAYQKCIAAAAGCFTLWSQCLYLGSRPEVALKNTV